MSSSAGVRGTSSIAPVLRQNLQTVRTRSIEVFGMRHHPRNFLLMINSAIIKTLTKQKKTISKLFRFNEPESFSGGRRQQHDKFDNLAGISLANNVEIWRLQRKPQSYFWNFGTDFWNGLLERATST